MHRNFLYVLKMNSQQRKSVARRRHRRIRPSLGLAGLEDRKLLSGGPTIYTVTDTSGLSTDTGSLVFAINQANANPNPAGSLIEFSKSVFSTPQTITVTSELELFDTPGPITIDGPGANLLKVSGGDTTRVFDIETGATAVLSGLTISDGLDSDEGGGIFNEGTLSLLNSKITDNSVAVSANASDGDGGGIFNEGTMTISGSTITNNTVGGSDGRGGGIYNDNVMTITNSLITNNTISGSEGRGGGLFNDNEITISGITVTGNTASGTDADGGGIYNNFLMTLANSTVDGNSTSGTGGDGGGIFNDESLNIIGSTIAMNSAADEGGGIFNDDIMTLVNSTVADNSAGSQGGGVFTEDILTAVNATIADNSVPSTGTGGGLSISTRTTANIYDTIVAGNAAGTTPNDVDGTLSTTSSFNLIGTGGSGGLTNGLSGNLVGVANPGLGPLANNGGPTATIALLPGSPAVDAGSNALDGLANDQRGPGLVRIFDQTIDIGAVELQPATVTSVSVDWGNAGTAGLQTAADGLRLLPAGRNTDLPWSGVNQVQITFNEPVTLTAGEVTIGSARGINYGPVTITGSGETFTITLSRPITKADRVTIVISGAGIASYTRRLDVLPGDLDDNGVVNNADVKGVRSELASVTKATVFGDVVGAGTVSANDVKAVKRFLGKTLPKIRKVSAVALERTLAREGHATRNHHR